ncbi:flagellar hook-length control protein FliK [Erwinia sp. Leaf53]|uniref:flagellar hook-length control protein FliK n=1 Tax=Erwinia sp. Leaf53 TaxID=1736225 RepID=UPI0006F3A8FC|nr:flagellar hook-length control protein FliK [Erwinia sp. Leaf53]KQN56630.1 hypothetical protein ASF13_05780 [Erwinia sp. Leaf53]
MIPLPTPVTTSTTTATATPITSSRSGTFATDTNASTDAATAGDGAQPEFLTLLGNRLLSLAQQSGTGKPTLPDVSTEQSASDKSAAKSRLSDLLSALDKPDALNALLQPQTSGTLPAATGDGDSQLKPAIALSDMDLQALQALQAMLPASTLVPRTTQTAGKGEGLATDEADAGNGRAAGLLTSTTTSGTPRSSGQPLLSAHNDAGNQATDAAESASGPAFQQVMSTIGKDIDKENSSSATNATITTNAISAATAPLTPAGSSLVTAPATPQLNSQLGSPEWQQALGQQILMFSRNGQQTAELRLHPQDLGSIQISLKLDNDQAQLSLVSNHSQVRAALEAALPQLRSALAESGINLGQSNVSSDAFPQNQSFAGQQEQQRNNSGSQFSLASENSSDVTPLAVPAALQARAAGSSAVDIFA